MSDKTQNSALEEAMLIFREYITKELTIEAKELGFTLAHFEILRTIAENGSLTIKEVADKLSITPPSATALVDTLESRKLVSREQDKNDRRTTRVLLTHETIHLFAQIHKRKECLFHNLFAKLDEHDKTELLRIVKKMYQ